MPRLYGDWAHPCHICNWTGLTLYHICTGAGLTPATSALGLGSPLPQLRRNRAHPYHIGNGTGLTPASSAPGLVRRRLRLAGAVTACSAWWAVRRIAWHGAARQAEALDEADDRFLDAKRAWAAELADVNARLQAFQQSLQTSRYEARGANTRREHAAQTRGANTRREHAARTRGANTRREHAVRTRGANTWRAVRCTPRGPRHVGRRAALCPCMVYDVRNRSFCTGKRSSSCCKAAGGLCNKQTNK